MAQSSHKNQFPGFGLPHETTIADQSQLFPLALTGWGSNGVTLREQRMLDFINKITDKNDWETKVFNDEIVAKWKEEGKRFYNEGNAPDDREDPVWLSDQMFAFVSTPFLRPSSYRHLISVSASKNCETRRSLSSKPVASKSWMQSLPLSSQTKPCRRS